MVSTSFHALWICFTVSPQLFQSKKNVLVLRRCLVSLPWGLPICTYVLLMEGLLICQLVMSLFTFLENPEIYVHLLGLFSILWPNDFQYFLAYNCILHEIVSLSFLNYCSLYHTN